MYVERGAGADASKTHLLSEARLLREIGRLFALAANASAMNDWRSIIRGGSLFPFVLDHAPAPAPMLRYAKRLIVFVLGFSVLLIGIAMIVLPGPAFIVIPAGLAILATEFVWARHLLKKMKESGQRVWSGSTSSPNSCSQTAAQRDDSRPA